MRSGNAIGAVVVVAALAGLGIEAVDSFGGRDTAGAGGAAGAGPDAGAGDAAAATSIIEGFAFAPVRISVGGEVTWRNGDGAPHTVAAEDGSFESPLLEAGATFSHRFERAGTFSYLCTVHPRMTGTVEVGGTAPSAPADPYRSSGG